MSFVNRLVVALIIVAGLANAQTVHAWHFHAVPGCGWSGNSTWVFSPVRAYHPFWNVGFHRAFCDTPTLRYSTFYTPALYFGGLRPTWNCRHAWRPVFGYPYCAPSYHVSSACVVYPAAAWPALQPWAIEPSSIQLIGQSVAVKKSTLLDRPAQRTAVNFQTALGRTVAPTRFVSTTGQDPSQVVPTEMLSAADAIFAAGGYQQATQAYARLAVRYGVTDDTTTRRFVALVASRDFEQAAVVLQAALAGGAQIIASHLPDQSLRQLYGVSARDVDLHCEFLAKYALEHHGEALPLAMVGTWLVLDGQPDRAEAFLRRAARIDQAVAVGLVSTRGDSK